MSSFWRNWLTIWCVGVSLFGVVLIGGAFPATDGPVRALLMIMNPAADIVYSETLRFALGLMGAVSLGWAGTLFAVFRAAHALGPAAAPVWRMVMFAMVGWYVIDSSISIATGFALNAASNTLLMIGLLLPLWRSGVLGGATVTARA